jgi:hypothetical protein
LAKAKWEGGAPYQWTVDFNNAIKTALLSNNHENIVNYLKVPGARESAPTPEHYLPIIYVAGLQNEGEMAQCFAEGLSTDADYPLVSGSGTRKGKDTFACIRHSKIGDIGASPYTSRRVDNVTSAGDVCCHGF